MSQFPPPPATPFPNQGFPQPQPAKTNGAAIASLICGILGCVPVITSLAAVILGIVGIKGAASRQGSGKALAIIGLVLGIIGILGWTTFGGGMYVFYRASAQPRAVARQFIQDIAANKIDAAMAACEPGVKREDVADAIDAVQKLGALKSTTLVGAKADYSNGIQTWELGGAAVFDKAPKSFRATLHKVGNDYKIASFQFE